MSTLELLPPPPPPPPPNHIKYKTFSNITKILIISTLGGNFLCKCKGIEINPEEVPHVKRKECFNTDKSDVWNRLYHVIRGKRDHVTYFQNK